VIAVSRMIEFLLIEHTMNWGSTKGNKKKITLYLDV
jgi:hypothetical protein